MTDTLKTVVLHALRTAQAEYPTYGTNDESGWPIYEIETQLTGQDDRRHDRLANRITGHFLDREKVRAALIAALSETIEHVNNGSFREGSFEDPDEDGYVEIEWGHSDHVLTHPALMFGDGYAPTDKLVDRLIEGLAAGGSDQ